MDTFVVVNYMRDLHVYCIQPESVITNSQSIDERIAIENIIKKSALLYSNLAAVVSSSRDNY